ncbi:MAG: DNA internalization-related competence protein ComEC/Rec2 [Lachnospiraceae bacterium]|nr:DNA internalization-related competence protein ComEC/Rec2 [Lachnospiraceae bacterium]
MACEITGTVLSVRVQSDRTVMTVRGGKNAGKLRVTLRDADLTPVPGSVIRMRGKTGLYDKALNPGAFSYRDYYDSIGVWLRFSPDEIETVREGSRILRFVYTLRDRLAEGIRTYADPEDTGLLASLLLSDDSDVDPDVKDSFSFLGLYQMISLSGLQMLFLGSLLFELVRKRTGRKWEAFFLGLSAVLVLALFTGFSMSALRAAVIYMIRCGAVFLKRHFDFATGCAWALILLILTEPLRVLTSGFLFMAGIMVSIGILGDLLLRYLKIRGGAYRALFTALSVQTVLLPVRLMTSYAFSLVSPFVYALLLPCYGIIFILGLLGTIISVFSGAAGTFLFGAEHYFLTFMRLVTEYASSARGFTVITGKPAAVRVLLYFLPVVLVTVILRVLINRRKHVHEDREHRITSAHKLAAFGTLLSIIIIGLVFLRPTPLKAGTAELLMMDCGQGDAFLIRTSEGTVILSDSGSSTDDRFYRDQLKKVLLYYGIERIDLVLASHPDDDHTNALHELFAEGLFEAGYLLYPSILSQDSEYAELFTLAGENGTQVLPAQRGQTLAIPGGKLLFLWPAPGAAVSGNDASLVYRFEYGDRSVLFTGDISSEIERKLMGLTKTDVLKVPHHGARFSSSEHFLAAISPDFALISCARRNSYGHPAEETLARLSDAGAKILTTQHQGAVFVSLTPGGVLVKRME